MSREMQFGILAGKRAGIFAAAAIAVFAAILCVGCGDDSKEPPAPAYHIITFDADGGTVTPDSGITDANGTLASLPTPVRTGYTFDGWYTAKTGGTGVDTSTVFSKDATIYAQWKLITYKITFDANSGTVTPDSGRTGEGGKLASLPSPTRTGYTFSGWYSAKTGGTVVTKDSVFSKDTTIYANWTPVTYKITYDLDDGIEPTTANPTSYTVEMLPITLNNPTKAGYAFTGWTGANGTNPQKSVSIPKGSTGDKAYTANWIISYVITFDANGGTVTPASGATGDGWKLAFLPTPIRDGSARDGYIFVGWFTAVTGGTQVTVNRVYSADATIYARWTPAFTDERDGKIYKKVTIGTQTWMAENLNYDVPNNTTNDDVCYENSADSCAKYGRLYNWATAMGINTSYNNSSWSGSDIKHQGACPVDWHLPSDAEWGTLEEYVGGSHVAGTKLKSTSGWSNGNGSDFYGFSALPGGRALLGGSFYHAGSDGFWWSATEIDADDADGRGMGCGPGAGCDERVYWYYLVKTDLISVRCVQDD